MLLLLLLVYCSMETWKKTAKTEKEEIERRNEKAKKRDGEEIKKRWRPLLK